MLTHIPDATVSRPWVGRVAYCALGLIALVGASCAGDALPSSQGSIVFTELRIEELSATRAVARFRTSREATCEVLYGTGPDRLDHSATDPEMREGELSIDHEVPLEDLLPSTTYSWRARAVDDSGNPFLSELQSFETLAAVVATDHGSNVALASAGTTVSGKSSNWSGEPDDGSFGALNAIDGQMATEWSSDGDGDDAWLELALPGPSDLSAFGFRSRMMTDGSSIVTSVDLLLDGQTRLGPFETPDHATLYNFDFPEPVRVERVRVEVRTSTGGNTGAREVQLFAEP